MNKSQKNKTKKIKCVLPNKSDFYICSPSLEYVWKTHFKGTTKRKGKYKTIFKLNNNTAILDTDKDTSLTRIIHKEKKIHINLENNPYKVLEKIKKLLVN